jgi:hypothetical protein
MDEHRGRAPDSVSVWHLKEKYDGLGAGRNGRKDCGKSIEQRLTLQGGRDGTWSFQREQ